MEKNTVIAIILSAIIITGGMFITQMVNEKNAPDMPPVTVEDTIPVESAPIESTDGSPTKVTKTDSVIPTLGEQDYPLLRIEEKTDLYRIVFTTAGGVVSNLELAQQLDDGKPISMVLDGDANTGTFNMAFGGPEAPYITENFAHEKTVRGKEIIHEFSREFIKDGQVFSLTKTYRLIPGEYMIELKVNMETPDGKAVPLLDGDKEAYTISYGPQIGPEFVKLDGRYEIRDNVTWGPDSRTGKLKRVVHKSKEQFVQIGEVVNWAGVIGKYFAVIVDPGSGSSIISWDNRPVEGQDSPSRLQVSKPARRQSTIEDVYRYYIGPLNRAGLNRYNDATQNAFGVSGMGLQNAPKTSAILGWLESILRFLLEMFYKMIPNYGVAIILLTFLVKLILFPFTHKSYESTSKMQAVQPKLKELQAKYKEDPQRLNKETAELYKAEGVNPMGGCLPMLFQFPIFIALYGLLNKYFPLRGAEFIRGWITDLSAPEFIGKEFAQPLNLLIIDIPAIRLLPILYLGGQLLMTKVTQQGQTGTQSGAQQKMLTLGMPIFFFFILYNMPSGLLLYWTAMNIITIVQQLITNYVKKRKAAGGTA